MKLDHFTRYPTLQGRIVKQVLIDSCDFESNHSKKLLVFSIDICMLALPISYLCSPVSEKGVARFISEGERCQDWLGHSSFSDDSDKNTVNCS